MATLGGLQAGLSSYTPTWAERIPNAIQDGLTGLGMDKYTARRVFAQPVADALSWSPVGAVTGAVDQARAAFNAPSLMGKLAHGGLAAMNMAALPIPGMGGAVARVAERGAAMAGERVALTHLPSSASLASMPIPGAETLAKLARVESVPLAQARSSQSKMDWGAFNAGETPGPMFNGYADKPVAVRKEDGEFIILDGHHRAVSAINRGDSNLDMHVINARDYAPEVAGRKPAAYQGPSEDDLYNELFGHAAPPANPGGPNLLGGLAMDEGSRMARAAAQGFDTTTPLYHGTGSKFNSFKPSEHGVLGPGVYATDQRSLAESYAESRKYKGPGRVEELAGPKNMLDLNGPVPDGMRDALGAHQLPLPLPDAHTAEWDALLRSPDQEYPAENVNSAARAAGYDGMKYNWNDGESGVEHVIFDPKRVRRLTAAFDPRNAGSANLLGGLAAGVVGAKYLSQPQPDTQQPQ